MTETGCTYLGLPDDDDEILSTTVGYPCGNMEVKCVDKTGRILPIGQEGELCVRGYSVMHGYWGEPTTTSEVLEHSKWFHTG
jgi:fatty-acyl-CoA synthase